MAGRVCKLGFTVGVWDLFHDGHRNILTEAKKHCDELIVGVMTDYYVQLQKGWERPHDKQATRLANLARSGLADRICILNTLDMTPFVQLADIWILGEDQHNMWPKNWPHSVRIPYYEGVSTTKLIGDYANES
jgi:cytidyltransferase-like protein